MVMKTKTLHTIEFEITATPQGGTLFTSSLHQKNDQHHNTTKPHDNMSPWMKSTELCTCSLVYYLNVNILIRNNEAHCVVTIQLELLLHLSAASHSWVYVKKRSNHPIPDKFPTLGQLELQYEFPLHYFKKIVKSRVQY